jgi:hypothetical protein
MVSFAYKDMCKRGNFICGDTGKAHFRVIRYGSPDQILVAPFEYHDTDKRIAITGFVIFDKYGLDIRIDASTPCLATVHP